MTKRSHRVPEHYKDLAKSGLRVRYNGFWLGNKERDRVIGQWIDDTPAASAIIKSLIYDYIIGRSRPVYHSEQIQGSGADEVGAAGLALLDLDT